MAKFLAHGGVASRRKAEEIIAKGVVTVDGEVSTDPARDVDESNDVRVNGQPVSSEAREVWVVNKPAGVVSTAREPGSRPAVVELVRTSARLYPVGRLDADSTGLLLLTNDGELANQLTHPRYEVPKTYRARLRSPLAERDLERLRRGVELEDGPTAPARVRRLAEREIEIVLREGRNRQVRRMLKAVGNEVLGLQRVKFGPLGLDTLQVGGRLCSSPRAAPGEVRGDGVCDGLGFDLRLLMREPQRRVAGPHQFPVAPAVPLERRRRAMKVAAVGLDHESLLRPEEVDLDPALGDLHGGIEQRSGAVAQQEQRQDLRLQRAFQPTLLRNGSRTPPFLHECPQRAHAAAPRVHRCLDRRDVEQPPLRRPLEATAERPVSDDAGEVDQRPRRAGAGDAVHGSDLIAPQRPHPVETDAVDLATARGWGDDVDHLGSFVQQSQQRRRAAMRDEGTLTTSQCCRPEPTSLVDGGAADGIGPAEDPMQSTRLYAAVDCPFGETKRPQLGPRDHPVLSIGEPSQAVIEIGATFPPHRVGKSHRCAVSPLCSGKMRA
ncbi:MAG TPA: pseudouridine synthase [Solirubrobacterales bacterium]|nr:pseudouridine synthase [Solirubrobacterales bacterium]